MENDQRSDEINIYFGANCLIHLPLCLAVWLEPHGGGGGGTLLCE